MSDIEKLQRARESKLKYYHQNSNQINLQKRTDRRADIITQLQRLKPILIQHMKTPIDDFCILCQRYDTSSTILNSRLVCRYCIRRMKEYKLIKY